MAPHGCGWGSRLVHTIVASSESVLFEPPNLVSALSENTGRHGGSDLLI